jgi:hypothetical protein
MKTNIIKQTLLILGLVISSTALFGQVSQGGIPYSLRKDLKNTSGEKAILSKEIVNLEMSTIPNGEIDAILQNNAVQDLSHQFAYPFEVDIDLKAAATVDLLDVGRLYRLSIKSKEARSLNLIFKKYVLPKGAKLYLYSTDLKDIKGSFSAYNNKRSERLATLPIKGEEVIIEYFEPYYTNFEGKLILGKVNHDFVGIVSESGSVEDDFGSSGDCQVDINCVEGSNWQVEKRSVCRIIFDGNSHCSGALLNNTNQDGRPFFLTANHCICNQARADDCLFIFNYESATCNGGDGSTNQCISGATLRSTRAQSDFTLLELSLKPLSTYNPHYAGWDRNNAQPQGGVGIHHPRGDVKKISTHDITPINSDCMDFNFDGGCGSVFFPNNNFWLINPWSATTNGHSVTESASSGSPLFNSDHRIIGQLFGAGGCANDNCTDPSNDFANYGKIWASWNQGGTAGTQLQNWLDPFNGNQSTLNGADVCGQGIVEHLTLSNTETAGTNELYQVTETINSTSTIQSGANITYRAGEMISLNPGFSAAAGSVFLAEIVPLDCVPGCFPISVAQLPNVFTPNGDGINDYLYYNTTNATSYEFQAFNRWGNSVYSSSGPVINDQAYVWDGSGSCGGCWYAVIITFRNECDEYTQAYGVTVFTGNKSANKNNTTQLQANAQNLEHSNSSFDFEVYPNPNSGQFSIQINATELDTYSLDIINSVGASVHHVEQLNESTLTLNTINLVPGVYYIRLNNNNNIITKKMIVR